MGTKMALFCRAYWKDRFVGESVVVAGYGRVTKKQKAGKDTTSCKLRLGQTKVLGHREKQCRTERSTLMKQTLIIIGCRPT